jgi:hypothetical protein
LNLFNFSKTPDQASASSNVQISQICICILGRLFDQSNENELIKYSYGIPILLEWLNSKWMQFQKVQEAVVEAISSLCKGSCRLATQIACSSGKFLIDKS